ncbi:MAG: HDOD domain-containing protein [gamma proteobacterium endosymbiont of Lamellibrachia anaximandri]|nr:HDOD domain-containing protein [gamma proteobacterium endosymbiont of Lamellibrachia anaximandri]MBL3616683.1 HDOD domain-containing protein [gamma proteobacterium endosymbiont of Lamellibrachia anaximandri]
MAIAQAAKQKILQIKHLPPLSGTASSLLGIVSDPDVDIDELSRIIGQDPGLTARILGLANAAYFAQSQPVNTVKEAIIRVLGLNMVKSLALSIVMCGAFDTSMCPGFELEKYWYSALGGAALARRLAMKMAPEERPDADGVYLGGLLVDLGVLVLVNSFPKEYSMVLQRQQLEPEGEMALLEQQLIGVTSSEAGSWLADRWHLPESVVRIINYQIYSDDVRSMGKRSEILLVGASMRWIKDSLSGDQISLKDDLALHQVLGIPAEVLESLEVEFLEKEDEIRTLARMLAG